MPSLIRTVSLTGFAMLCFAANSLLCRIALESGAIDPATFTTVRVASAVLVLVIIMAIYGIEQPRWSMTHWRPVAALLAYLILFSFAYTRLHAGTGALLLFGTVQLTMFTAACRKGERLPVISWMALSVAIAGLIYLLLPGIEAPDISGAAMMIGSGAAWGVFTLLARGFSSPIKANATSFLGCLPVVATINVASESQFKITLLGLGCAIASGAIASGIGYAVWYVVLPNLTRAHAATVQLLVPPLAALGGVLFLSEPITLRLVISSIAILAGVAVVLLRRPSGAPT